MWSENDSRREEILELRKVYNNIIGKVRNYKDKSEFRSTPSGRS